MGRFKKALAGIIDKVLDLNDFRPHEGCVVACTNCGFKYVAVFMVKTKFPLECRECGLMKVERANG